MIGCLRTRIRKQPIIALYFESEYELKFYNLEARSTIKVGSKAFTARSRTQAFQFCNHLPKERQSWFLNCVLAVMWLLLVVCVSSSRGLGWSVIVAFPDHTHFLFACGALAASICVGIVIPSIWLSIYITYC